MAVRPLTLHVGTYTDGASKGIYRLDFDPVTGALGEPVLAAEAVNPAFLAWHPRLPVLYTVSETDTGPDQQGLVIAFGAAADGGLTTLDEQPSGGAAPCYVSVDPSGARLFVANYHGGSVAALPLDAGGRLQPPSFVGRHYGSSVHPVRQRKSYAHAIVPAPAAPVASFGPAKGGARAAAASGAAAACRATAACVVRARRGSGRRSRARLSHRRSERSTDPARRGHDRGGAGRWPASPRVHARRRHAVRDQRTELDNRAIHMERGARHARTASATRSRRCPTVSPAKTPPPKSPSIPTANSSTARTAATTASPSSASARTRIIASTSRASGSTERTARHRVTSRSIPPAPS